MELEYWCDDAAHLIYDPFHHLPFSVHRYDLGNDPGPLSGTPSSPFLIIGMPLSSLDTRVPIGSNSLSFSQDHGRKWLKSSAPSPPKSVTDGIM